MSSIFTSAVVITVKALGDAAEAPLSPANPTGSAIFSSDVDVVVMVGASDAAEAPLS